MWPLSVSWGLFLGLLWCWSSPVCGEEAPKINVSVSGKNVTLTCPGNNAAAAAAAAAAWFKLRRRKYEHQQDQSQQTLVLTEGGKEVQGQYACASPGGTTYIGSVYLKVKVCDNCMELSLGLVAGIIISDLLVTLGVLLLVYYCSKNRVARFGGGAAGGGTRGRPRGQKMDSPPPVPNPDYEPLRKGQREVYAGLEPSRAF